MKKSDKIKYQKMTRDQLVKELAQIKITLVESTIKHSLDPIKDTSVFAKIKTKISYLATLVKKKDHEKTN